jgi:hypothetical protein
LKAAEMCPFCVRLALLAEATSHRWAEDYP